MRILVIKLIRRAQRSAAARPWFDCVFRVALLPVFVRLFRLMRLDDMQCGPAEVSFASVYAKAMKVFSTPAGERRLRNDVIACFLYYQVSPEEYFMYEFAEKPHAVRKTYLSDVQRFYAYVAGMGWEPFLTLRDKVEFSKLARPYFRREVCPLPERRISPPLRFFAPGTGAFSSSRMKPHSAAGAGWWTTWRTRGPSSTICWRAARGLRRSWLCSLRKWRHGIPPP